MGLTVIRDGDILKTKADVIVIPTFEKGDHTKMGIAKRVYKAAGYQQIRNARIDVGVLRFGDIAVTPGFDLYAKHVIHICTPYTKFPHSDSRESLDTYSERSLFRLCLLNALRWAEGNGAESIAIPLISLSSRLSLPEVEVLTTRILRNYLSRSASCLKIYFVVPPSSDPVYINQEDITKQEEQVSETPEFKLDSNIFTEYGIRLGEERTSSGKMPDKFNRDIVEAIIKKYRDKKTFAVNSIAETINYDKGLLSKFIKGTVISPHKHRLIAIAVAAGFDDEERFRFINCAGRPYPTEERDMIVEYLLRSGTSDFKSLNERLSEINPEYALDANTKKWKYKNPNKNKTAEAQKKDM